MDIEIRYPYFYLKMKSRNSYHVFRRIELIAGDRKYVLGTDFVVGYDKEEDAKEFVEEKNKNAESKQIEV